MKGQKEVQANEAQRVHKIMEHIPPEKATIAIDGGAHVGSWAAVLSGYFDHVIAFEPCNESYAMLVENMSYYANVECVEAAIMDKRCLVDVVPPKPKRLTLTARHVVYGGDTQAMAIDELGLEACGLIKLDLEGAELQALKGAEKTITKFEPFLVIEFNNLLSRFNQTEGQLSAYLKKLGYKEVWREGVDRGFKHE